MSNRFYMGWDVGGWNCDKNALSRDALVVLNEHGQMIGNAWRGNIREIINTSQNTRECILGLFELCELALPETPFHVTLAIDTPLGFSTALIDLLTEFKAVNEIGDSQHNPYLYRETERFLFSRGLKPLSPIKDMIGSQATKGMHFLAKFAPQCEIPGVWSEGEYLTAFEGYPSACKRSLKLQTLYEAYPDLIQEDKRDALWCALLAFSFEHHADLIAFPELAISKKEGWIFVPQDALKEIIL